MLQTRQKVFRIVPKCPKMSPNVPKCPKMSHNVPKCPTQTHRCPNGYRLRAIAFGFSCFDLHFFCWCSCNSEDLQNNQLTDAKGQTRLRNTPSQGDAMTQETHQAAEEEEEEDFTKVNGMRKFVEKWKTLEIPQGVLFPLHLECFSLLATFHI